MNFNFKSTSDEHVVSFIYKVVENLYNSLHIQHISSKFFFKIDFLLVYFVAQFDNQNFIYK